MATNANHIALDPNFVDDAKDRLLSQFKQSANINSILEIEASRFKTLDDTVYSIAVGRLLENAVGVQLDNIGQSLGIPRDGYSDTAYRQVILFRTFSANLSPTRDELHNFVASLTGGYPDLTTFHTSTHENPQGSGGTGFNSGSPNFKYVDVLFYPNCLTTAGLNNLKSAFPVITTVYPLAKELPETIGCIALDNSNTEIASNQPRIKGLGAIDSSGDVVVGDDSGYLCAMTDNLAGVNSQYAIDTQGDFAVDTNDDLGIAPDPS